MTTSSRKALTQAAQLHSLHYSSPSKMRTLLLGLYLSIIPLCYGSPPYWDGQVVFDGYHHPKGSILSNAKKAMLKGKTNQQKWLHDGKEFITQNGLMCQHFCPIQTRPTEFVFQMNSCSTLPSRHIS
jgi:hypothetical protein